MARISTALTIAGSDSSGGAGIQADLKTFTAFGVYGASVITALTAQNTTGVSAIHTVPAAFIEAQFDAVADDLAIGAIKTGMLGDAPTVATVAGRLGGYRNAINGSVPIIVDPVMVATSGASLLQPDAVATLIARLLPLATLATPNLHEAAQLLSEPVSTSMGNTERQAIALLGLGPAAVLLKGGHGVGDLAIDVYADKNGLQHFSRPRIVTRNTHGTGCTLSAAIAACLVDGRTLIDAIAEAKSFVWNALREGAGVTVGRGNGPLNHLYSIKTLSNRS